MEFAPHYWNQGVTESNSESDESDTVNQTLPRQSVMRRPGAAPIDGNRLLLPTRRKSGSDYHPSSEEEDEGADEEGDEEVSSDDDSSDSDDDKSTTALKGRVRKRARFQSEDESVEENDKPAIRVKMDVRNFYKARLQRQSPPSNCFYKMEPSSTGPTAGDATGNIGYQRRAARNVCYTMDSESDGEEEQLSSRKKRKFFQSARTRDSDSDFQVSNNDEEEDDMMSFGSDSLVDESSSDGYTPYSSKRGGGGGAGRNKKGGRQWSDDGFGRMRKGQQLALFSDEASDSDYDPGGSRKQKRARKGRRKRQTSDYEYEDDEEFDGYTRTTGRQREHISYKESSDEEEEGGEKIPIDGATAIEDDNREKVDRILLKRMGVIGDTGKTCYAVTMATDAGGPLEVQYLVKWLGWSHLHNTWETEATLMRAGVKGIKRLHNYIKKEEERSAWEERASPEDLEYSQIQQELNERLLDQFKQVERVIDARRTEEGSGQEYLCKWTGLPYSECTWEDGALITDLYQQQIDCYMFRNESDCIPCRSDKVLRHRPKFSVFKEQPGFLAGGNTQVQLRDYQLDGVNWLVNAWCKHNSVILADEMGLGKTIQTISFLSCLFHVHHLYGPFLLVVPLSTLPSWQKEFQLWAPDMNVLVYIGDVTSRNMIQQTEWAHANGNLKFNAVVTTYEILLKDKDFLGSVSWAVLVVDEAHRLKNDDSLLYRTLNVFHTNHRLLITGTPLQNSLKELWSLIHFIMKDKFPSWEAFEEEHQANGEANTANLSSLHQQLEPYLLRRMKKDVEKSLPSKVEQILRVEMSSVQKQYYRWILTRNYKALSKGVKGSITGFINVIMELKKCCNHVHIVRTPDTPEVRDPLQSLLRGSGKLYLLDKLLVRLKETGHRILIFSQMVRMLDILAEYMKLRRFLFQRLDGSINGQQRREAIDHFNAEGSQDFCFLLSTRAGGLGVNLATADTVVIFDSDWNPQNDLQAQARAHRIGQTKQVNIYRLVTRNSIEEDIIEKAKRKMVLDHLVIQRMDTTGRTVLSQTRGHSNNVPFDKDELNAILKFGTEELFKEDDKEEDKALKEMDIDEILRRAETQEMAGEESSVAQELLSQFKVASFTMDEEEFEIEDGGRRLSLSNEVSQQFEDKRSWDDIIPEAYRNQIEEEEREKEQLQLYLPPRQRTVRNYYEEKVPQPDKPVKTTQSRTRNDTSRGSRRHKITTSADSNSVIVVREAPGFTNGEIRRFVSSYLKFPSSLKRLDAIAVDAELQEKSMSEMEQLATLLHKGCQEACDLHKEITASNTTGSNTSPPTLKLGGVSIPAENVLQKEHDMNLLAHYIPTDPQARKRFRLVTKVPLKQVTWPGVKWTSVDDSKLLVGVYQYGLGNWESIKDDTSIGLSKKILPVNRQEKPQVQHLKTRVNFLLKALRDDSSRSDDTKRKTSKRNRERKDVKETQKISKYFPVEANHRNSGSKRKPAKELSDGPKRTKTDESEQSSSVTDDSGSEDDDDFVDDWKRKRSRQRKRPAANSKPESNAKKRIKNSKGKAEPVKQSSRSKAVKRNSRPSRANGQKSKRNEEDIVDEYYIVSDFELDEETFTKCKLMLKPVKKCLMQLSATPDPESDPSQHNTIVEIGDHISTCLTAFSDSDVVKEWRSHLWIFVAKFTAVSGRKLFTIYRNLKSLS